MGIRSAYRQIKETVRGPDKQFVLDTMALDLERHWQAVTRAGLAENAQLRDKREQALAQLEARDPKAAGKTIMALEGLIPDVQVAMLEQERKDRQAQKTATMDVTGKALSDEFERDAATLRMTREPAAANRASQARPQTKEVEVTLDYTPEVGMEGRRFASRITVDGDTFDSPEYIAKGGFGVTARYTAADGKTVVMKQVQTMLEFQQEDLARELEINRKLSEGPVDAPGRENVLLMKGFVQGDDDTAYILMDEASGDLNMMKHGMNALSEAGGLPEEVRNVLNQQMMKQALQGAKYMHDQGVDHFDLKEGNMLMMPDGTVKLIDFGGSVADGKEGEEVSPAAYTPGYFTDSDGMDGGKLALKRNKWDAFSLGTMLETLHHGEDPLGRGEALTGALGRVHDSMTDATAQDRTTLEAALESAYFRNLDSYQPETIKELMAATAAYSKALGRRGAEGAKVGDLSKKLHKERLLLQEREAEMKAATGRGEVADVEAWKVVRSEVQRLEAALRLLANDAELEPHRARILEISQRLQSGA